MKLCREKIRKAKAQLELNLATKVKENNKYFYKYINSKRRSRENFHPFLDTESNMVTKDQDKDEVFNASQANWGCPGGLETGKCDAHLQKGLKR